MKTAMQELIELMKQMPAFQYEPVVHGIYNKATELLDKEKEQIMGAYLEGQIDEGYERKHKDVTDYYEKTYNQ